MNVAVERIYQSSEVSWLIDSLHGEGGSLLFDGWKPGRPDVEVSTHRCLYLAIDDLTLNGSVLADPTNERHHFVGSLLTMSYWVIRHTATGTCSFIRSRTYDTSPVLNDDEID